MGGWDLEKKQKRFRWFRFCRMAVQRTNEKIFRWLENESRSFKNSYAEPDVLFLDEPTNHLDLEATIWLEKFLASWKGGMVLISHDRTFLDRSINHVIEIDLGKIKIYKGTYSDFLKNKKVEMDLYLNAYKNQQREIKET